MQNNNGMWEKKCIKKRMQQCKILMVAVRKIPCKGECAIMQKNKGVNPAAHSINVQ